MGAFEGKLKQLEHDLGLFGKKGSEEESFENLLGSEKLDTVQSQIDALGVTVIPFGGRDDQPPRKEEET